jgi:hypothetical protein
MSESGGEAIPHVPVMSRRSGVPERSAQADVVRAADPGPISLRHGLGLAPRDVDHRAIHSKSIIGLVALTKLGKLGVGLRCRHRNFVEEVERVVSRLRPAPNPRSIHEADPVPPNRIELGVDYLPSAQIGIPVHRHPVIRAVRARSSCRIAAGPSWHTTERRNATVSRLKAWHRAATLVSGGRAWTIGRQPRALARASSAAASRS